MAETGKAYATKQDVIDEIIRLRDAGHSLKTEDIDKRLYYAICKFFGGWKNLKRELGICTRMRRTERRKSADAKKVVWTEERIREEFMKAVDSGLSRNEIASKYPKLNSAIVKRYGNLTNYCSAIGVELPYRRNEIWTKDAVITEIMSLYRSGMNVSSNNLRQHGYSRLVCAGNRHFGTWNAALRACGIRPIARTWSRDSIVETVRALLKDGCPCTLSELNRRERGLENAIRTHFGGISPLKEALGICNISDKPKTLKERSAKDQRSPRKRLIDDILTRYNDGLPLNYECVRDKGILDRAKRYFGSWKNAVEAAGISYDNVRVDTETASYKGYVFESLLGELLEELSIQFRKYEHESLKPDFVLHSGVWMDAKLSEWSIFSRDCATIKQYEPRCKLLTIVYLRGDRDCDRMITKKTRLISVYRLVKQLPAHKQKFFIQKFDELLTNLDEQAA